MTEAAGFALAPRLTIYPEFACDPQRWLDESLRFAVHGPQRRRGAGPRRSGCGVPRTRSTASAGTVGDGAEVVLIGDRSTQWYSGRHDGPPRLVRLVIRSGLVPRRPGLQRGAVAEVLEGVRCRPGAR